MLDWATDGAYSAGTDPWSGQPNALEPSSGEKRQGVPPKRPFGAQKFNWLFREHANWKKWLESKVGAGFFGAGGNSTTFDGTSAVVGFTRVGTTYTATQDIYLLDMTVNAGVRVFMANFRLFVLDTITNDGKIDCDGTAGASTLGGAAHAPGTLYGGTSGGNGGVSGHQAGYPGTDTGSQVIGVGGLGGTGGQGDNGSGGTTAGGAAGGQFVPISSLGLDEIAAIIGGVFAYDSGTGLMICRALGGGTGGGGGGYDIPNAHAGGGAGSGAGSLVICAGAIVNNGTISANGGAGENAPSAHAGAGSGGGGGRVDVITGDLSGSGTITATGGTAGTGSWGTAAMAGADGRVTTYNLGA